MIVLMEQSKMTDPKPSKAEYGDFQTPLGFAEKVCAFMKDDLGVQPKHVLEPTFGMGSFLEAAIKVFNGVEQLYGIEVNPAYHHQVQDRVDAIKGSRKASLYLENIFSFDFSKIRQSIDPHDELLIVGNPPWVTNSELSAIGSHNLPVKGNFKALKGLDAITGKGNFDIAEFILLQLLNEFSAYHHCHIAMLCKTIVARNIIRDIGKYDFHLSDIRMLTFDAKDIFGVSCEAGLLVMRIGKVHDRVLTCSVFDFKNPHEMMRRFGWINNNFISNVDRYTVGSMVEGTCAWEWRQGIKHDCSRVMELSAQTDHGCFFNGNRQAVCIEDDRVYPLLKSSDLKQPVITASKRNVIVTQSKVKDDTASLQHDSPKLWAYLQENEDAFDRRKSAIYKHSPRFSIFGIGDYSFKPYKVALSGFYKEPRFVLAYGEKPVMFDDTCYFIGFDDYKSALITMLLLNSDAVQNLLKSIAFKDAKRPYTKDILMRIDIGKTCLVVDYPALIALADKLAIRITITADDYSVYRKSVRRSMIDKRSDGRLPSKAFPVFHISAQ